ncbi:hypothetical protein KZX46_09330 [Polymorphobacter sp. PAMC 29334]|uniref:hypothetical protein n=1 Tax=Polymorphobacter sp. PAMC 29334 TaxID=2862331 RepID=UPI001C74BA69|nr:hypothetical protein [Polymorphobacter sp. PAMC 29334]QYE36109.1 hypothetical protein KZX46_09330 [Polymorphobacter sp. PAMC 29334]
MAIMIALGFVARLVWLLLDPATRMGPHRSEMWHVAATFAETGVLGDAYRPGSGPSSHVGPFNPIVGGLVYRVLGVGTPAAEMALAVIAGVIIAALFWFLYRVAARLGVAPVPRLVALAFLALVPLNFYVEAVDFRIREGGLAAMLGAGLLLWTLHLDARGPLTLRAVAGFGLAAAFAFLINPGIALGAYAGLGLVALRHLRWQRWLPAAVLLAVGFVVVNGPWIARNAIVYDRFMPSRGNFGMELDTAYHAAAVDPVDPRAVFVARSEEIHPFFSDAAYARFKTFPDDATYFAMLGVEAKQWIAAHKGEAAGITLRHLRELYFPPLWLFDQYGIGKNNLLVKLAIVWATTGLALAAIVIGLREQPRHFVFVLLTIIFPTLIYIIVQPTLRYRYAFTELLTFLAAGLLWRLIGGRTTIQR